MTSPLNTLPFTGKKVHLQRMENIIFILVVFYANLPLNIILMVFWMKCYNYTIEVIKIYVTYLIIIIFTLTSI